ncbi:hypothetical protein N7G274_007630 [Stereocaulon virgatum]|uniref:Uncharacterized protein n=1 Tax=Stereocaulon virgatum TaxID=373712 RepID=A0ABR4A4B6_9LECA
MPPTDTDNPFISVSGIPRLTSGIPFDTLLEAYYKNHSAQIQNRYETHRETRNEKQKDKILAPDFSGFSIDPILEQLSRPDEYPGYVDPRN